MTFWSSFPLSLWELQQEHGVPGKRSRSMAQGRAHFPCQCSRAAGNRTPMAFTLPHSGYRQSLPGHWSNLSALGQILPLGLLSAITPYLFLHVALPPPSKAVKIVSCPGKKKKAQARWVGKELPWKEVSPVAESQPQCSLSTSMGREAFTCTPQNQILKQGHKCKN